MLLPITRILCTSTMVTRLATFSRKNLRRHWLPFNDVIRSGVAHENDVTRDSDAIKGRRWSTETQYT